MDFAVLFHRFQNSARNDFSIDRDRNRRLEVASFKQMTGESGEPAIELGDEFPHISATDSYALLTISKFAQQGRNNRDCHIMK